MQICGNRNTLLRTLPKTCLHSDHCKMCERSLCADMKINKWKTCKRSLYMCWYEEKQIKKRHPCFKEYYHLYTLQLKVYNIHYTL